MIARPIFFILLYLLGGCSIQTSSPSRLLTRFHEARPMMGTFLEITIFVPPQLDGQALLDSSFALAERLEAILSKYQLDSELSFINRSLSKQVTPLSPYFAEFLSRSSELSLRTSGAFDITIGPLSNLWQQAALRGSLPTPTEQAAATLCVGTRYYTIQDGTLITSCPTIQFDSDGIGKGFAVDKIVAFLHSAGVDSALVHFGRSSSAALGAPPGEPAWRLLLAFGNDAQPTTISLRDQALSASDTMGRTMTISGTQYGHIFDPISGLPANAGIQSYVIAHNATSAEAASKFVILRGIPTDIEAKGLGLVEVYRASTDGVQSMRY